jgi:hypothetical protein
LEKRKSAAIQFGSAEGLQGLLGHDFGTVSKQASDNPYSVLKNLQWGYEHGVADLEEKLNKANLFYSGYRGEQLGDAAHQFQQSNYNARTQFQGLLSDVADQLAAALMQADYNEMLAAMNAQASSFPGPAAPPGPPVAAPPAPPATPPWVTQAAAAFNPTTTYALRTPPQFRPNPYMPGAY